MKDLYRVAGVMSGSSLDGIDIALCELRPGKDHWNYRIIRSATVGHDATLKKRLLHLMHGTALDLARMHLEFGRKIGEACRELIAGETIDLIASHGHTVFHKPGEGLTAQIGCGATIAAITGTTTVCDFRTMDVALGGQGAPLVPLGEKLLFPEYDCFINLGGIANISIHTAEGTTGFDIGPCNMMMNLLAEETGQAYDKDGAIAASGEILPDLLARLNALPFYTQDPPRSLGREWFEVTVEPLLMDRMVPLADRMRTVVEHIAMQLAAELENHEVKKVMITGGGAHNKFLIARLRQLTSAAIELPEKEIIDQKEALIFALLGVLRVRGVVNALAGVTGAKRDSVGGAVYRM